MTATPVEREFGLKIESSSLGTPEAQALRASVSDEKAAALVEEARRRSVRWYPPESKEDES